MGLLSFSLMFSDSFMLARVRIFFLLEAEWYPIICMTHVLFIILILCQWIWGFLLVMVKNAAMNVNMVSLDLFFVVSEELTFVERKKHEVDLGFQ